MMLMVRMIPTVSFDLTNFNLASAAEDEVPFLDRDQAAAALQHVTGQLADLPIVQLGPRHAEVADACWLTIVSANDPRYPQVMTRGNALVRQADGLLEPLSKFALRDRISRSALFTKTTVAGNSRDTEPPLAIAETILSRTLPDFWGVPQVERVVEVPVLRPDGELIIEPGYHADGRVYYRPTAGLEHVSDHVLDWHEHDDVVQARSILLDDLLGDFAFVSEADRANALGLLLLPFVRDVVGSFPTPMHAIVSHDPESGKGTLAQACLVPGCGLMPATPFEAGVEMRKQITALLQEGRPAVLFDNLHETVADPNLAAALTTGLWSDRRLGYTEMLRLPVKTVWAATANNPTMSREHRRRTTVIQILKRPAGYEFKHHNLIEWAVENRPRLVGAALTLVKFWASGRARLNHDGSFSFDDEDLHLGQDNLGSFERWARVVGGILGQADVSGFIQNRRVALETIDVETQEDTRFVKAWRELYGDERVTSRELASKLSWPPLCDVLPIGLVGLRPDQAERSLRYWLRSRRGRNYDGLVVTAQEQARAHLWSIEPSDETHAIS